ncbi:MAG: choice-of-anchor tandem repeat GloVer-containing protein [Bryobacteraceae bacterium]
MKRIVNKLHWACVVLGLFPAAAVVLRAQTFTTLHSFDGADGRYSLAGLVQATNGDFYGTTIFGGVSDYGEIFKITPSGALTALYSFCAQSDCSDGQYSRVGLIQATDGDFYGTTYAGGANACGTVFKVAASGTLTTLYSFCAQSGCTDGEHPSAGLVQAASGDFYGTTVGGGANCAPSGCGTVFKITTGGTLTTLYSFCAQTDCSDGQGPEAGLVQATNGDLYGTTWSGGVSGEGTVFKIAPSGALTTLYSFCSQFACADGAGPSAGLVQGGSGDLYGTTQGGGNNAGTVFKITPSGTLTTLYAFCSQSGCPDGSAPYAALVQASNGDFYGTTYDGGANLYWGTIFKIAPSGTLTTLYSFCSQSGCTDGEGPEAGIVQATNGDFYGTTAYGGASNQGTVFSLSVGLAPFVKTLPTSGKTGAAIGILGTDLTGATNVTFNGTPAAFTVVSRTLITTTVPAGATTGNVEVTTPSGTLSTRNVNFQVLP